VINSNRSAKDRIDARIYPQPIPLRAIEPKACIKHMAILRVLIDWCGLARLRFGGEQFLQMGHRLRGKKSVSADGADLGGNMLKNKDFGTPLQRMDNLFGLVLPCTTLDATFHGDLLAQRE